MTARSTYTATITSAVMTKAAADLQAEMVKQVTIDAQRSVVGYTLQTGNNANLLSAVKNANAAKSVSSIANEQTKQTTINVAADTLRGTGDTNPL